MDDEIELISDGDGLAVIGDPAAIEQFLASEDLPSKELNLPSPGTALSIGGAAAQAGSEIAANSGRWVQLTKESSELVKKYGLRESKRTGLSTGVVRGSKGQVKGFLEFAKGPASALTNPAMLAGAAGVMSQMAMQQTIDEITAYLATIDEKVDDLLRAQRDAVLADMIGVDLVIEEAMTVREQVGRVSEVTWSKVQSTSATIARTQAYALRQLDAIAEKVEHKADFGDLASASKEAESKTQEWLAVLARCFQLHDAMAVLELDRVLDASPDELDRHRLGLKTARHNRLGLITGSTSRLLARMDAAASEANTKVLMHPAKAPAIVHATNRVSGSIVNFQGLLGIETSQPSASARRWRQAAGEVRDKAFSAATEAKDKAVDAATVARDRAVEAGAGGVDAAKRLGNGTRDRGRSVRAKVSESRARHRS